MTKMTNWRKLEKNRDESKKNYRRIGEEDMNNSRAIMVKLITGASCEETVVNWDNVDYIVKADETNNLESEDVGSMIFFNSGRRIEVKDSFEDLRAIVKQM